MYLLHNMFVYNVLTWSGQGSTCYDSSSIGTTVKSLRNALKTYKDIRVRTINMKAKWDIISKE